MYCQKCGNEIPNDAAYCALCGAKAEQPRNNFQYRDTYGDNYVYTPAAPPTPSPEVAEAESKAVSSLVLGILGNVFGSILLGFILGPLAISRANAARSVLNDKNHNFWIALAGKITGIIAIVESAVVAVVYIIYFIVFVTVLAYV